MPCFQLRGWIGVHKERIPPGPEFLLRFLLGLKETDFTPVPLLVMCPDLPAFIHRYDDLHSLSPYTHIPLHSWTLPPASCPPRSSLLRQESPYRAPGPVIPTGMTFVRYEVPAIVLGRCAPPHVLCGQAARSPDVLPVGSVPPLPSIDISSHCVIDRWGKYAESCLILDIACTHEVGHKNVSQSQQ
jgi:hypothetical protein